MKPIPRAFVRAHGDCFGDTMVLIDYSKRVWDIQLERIDNVI